MDADRSQDMKEVLRQEQGRGKRYIPSEEEKKAYRKRKKQLKDALRVMRWEEVVSGLSLRKGTPEYEEYSQIWKEYHRDCDESY